MIKIEHTEVFGFEAAIRGMRNPLESWANSDSFNDQDNNFHIGENDLSLMKKLSAAGNDHAKYLRMINVTCDITAPLYLWKEISTYKVGTVANSCSTMHKIHAKEFAFEDFSHEHLLNETERHEALNNINMMQEIISHLNFARKMFLRTKDKRYWWQMIQLLPSSYNQKRTIQLNYQVLKNMYYARKNHKLDEWRDFCKWIEFLPYAKELLLIDQLKHTEANE